MILLVNYNWDVMPKYCRIFISFLPLLIASGVSFYTIIKGKGIIWQEGSAVFTAAGSITCTALISHIYHCGGTFSDFMLLILLTTFPLLYIFNSKALAVLFAAGMFMSIDYTVDILYYFALLGVFVPFLILLLKRDPASCCFARYLVIPVVLFSIVVFAGETDPASFCLYIGVFFFLLACNISEKLGRNPWLVCSYGLLLSLLCCATFEGGELFNDLWKWPSLILLGGPGAGSVFLLIQKGRKKEFSGQDCILAILLFSPFSAGQPEGVIKLFFNLILAVWGIMMIINACRQNSVISFNSGMVMIALLVICRFFDGDISMLVRAFAFIVVGIGFIAANICFVKKIKSPGKVACHDEK